MEQTQDTRETWERASVALEQGMHFVGDVQGFRVDLDADESVGGQSMGPRPMRLLLLGLAGCTAMDVISILRKQRQQVASFEVEVRGHRAEEHPRVYDEIEVVYRIRGTNLDRGSVDHAVELSESR